MLNVQEIRRNVINVVKNYSDAQVKVRKATSNEPWGPCATLMAEIADLTYNVVAFSEIMQIIWKRLNDHGKNWRHVYKALVLLEYLIKTGSEKVAQQCRDNLFAIQTLKDFQYFEESKDQGMSIREKSKMLVNLLKDEEKLKVERARALKAKERFNQSLSYMGNSSDGGEQAFKSSSSYPESLSQSENVSSRALNSDLESARPQTAGEEKLQLELALAMSKEEAEQEERLRKNDDLRLKLALEESEKNAGKSKQESSHSAVDELLSLGQSTSSKSTTDPWGSTIASPPAPHASLLPSPPMNKNKTQIVTNHNDPWSASVIDQPKSSTSFDDPWSSPVPTSSNDPWSLNNVETEPTVANNDPWNSPSSMIDPGPKNKPDFGVLNEASKTNSNPLRRTPESFLGPNSNLVNLDALVSKVQTSTSPNNNPFASAVAPVVNPFQANKPSQPTINELRAQNNLLGGSGGTSPVMFSSSSTTPQFAANFSTTTVAAPLYQPSSSSSNSVWGTFPLNANQSTSAFTSTNAISPQPNNPFAM